MEKFENFPLKDEDTNPEICDPVLLCLSRMEGKLDTMLNYIIDLDGRVAKLESNFSKAREAARNFYHESAAE